MAEKTIIDMGKNTQRAERIIGMDWESASSASNVSNVPNTWRREMVASRNWYEQAIQPAMFDTPAFIRQRDEILRAGPAPDPVAVAVEIPEEEQTLMDYVALAKELGITSAQVAEMELRLWLRAEAIHVYDMESVKLYMDEKVRKEKPGHNWAWRGLREADHHRQIARANPAQNRSSIPWPSPYPHAVPMPVLLTVKRILERFKDAVSFYVTDYQVQKPDPFLAVQLHDSPLFVVERWDEPSFRER